MRPWGASTSRKTTRQRPWFCLKKAVALDNYPNYRQIAIYHALLAKYYFSVETNDEKALEECRKAIYAGSSVSEVYDLIGQIMLKEGRLDKAFQSVQQARKFKPDSPFYLNTLALILLKMNHPDAAISAARRALFVNSEMTSPLAVMGEAYLLKGQMKTSVFFWERYLEKEPKGCQCHAGPDRPV